jgi:hypothetical protein
MGQTPVDILDLDATYHRPGAARLAADLGAVLAPDTVAEQVAALPAAVAAEVFGTAEPKGPDPDDYDRAFGDHDSNGTA